MAGGGWRPASGTSSSADAVESLFWLQGSCFAVAHGRGRGQPALPSEELQELHGTCPDLPEEALVLSPGEKESQSCLGTNSPIGVRAGPGGFKSL